MSFLVGVESEFILLSATAPEPVYVNYADWSCTAKLRAGSTEARVLEEIAECLLDAGIELGDGVPGEAVALRGRALFVDAVGGHRGLRRCAGHKSGKALRGREGGREGGDGGRVRA